MTTPPPLDYTSQIHAFATIAREFVDLIDGATNVDDLVFALDDLLPRLYNVGSRLAVAALETVYDAPEVSAPVTDEPEDVDDASAPLAATLAALFEGEDSYHRLEYFDAGLENYDLEERSLSTDLALMHLVIKEQLAIYDLATPEYFEESGRGWLQGFEGIWGTQLPFLLAAMNHRIYGELTNEELDEELEEDEASPAP